MIPCDQPAVLHALHDPAVAVADTRWRAPEPGSRGPAHASVRRTAAPPPDAAKGVYGTPYDDRVDSANFTVEWAPGVADPDMAQRASDALEAAWSTFVDDQGWTPPVSSDRYLLWVMLVDDLGGTGYTTLYTTPEYPQGYPVLYLDVAWASQPAFWRSLAVHELHHALQFAARPTWGDAGEGWFWEATAGWASVAVEPDSDAIDYTASWYAVAPEARFDTADGLHEYGMFTFTTWLEEAHAGSLHAAWHTGDTTPGAWDARLAEVTGEDATALWARFSEGYARDAYGRTATWEDPAVLLAEDGAEGGAETLGARTYVIPDGTDGAVEVTVDIRTGGAVVSPGGASARAGERVTVTATEDGSRWTLRVGPVTEDDSVAGDDAPEKTSTGGCSATVTSPRWANLLAGLLAVALLRRR